MTSTPLVWPYSGWPGVREPHCRNCAQVVELEAEAGEVEHRVEQHRRVPGREHEAVAVGPVGIGRVVLHDARPQHVGERRERHRRARVPGVRLLHRVHREAADHVDRALLEARRPRRPLSAASQPTRVPAAAAYGRTRDSASERTQRSKTATLRGEAVQEVAAADRADLARAERARERHRPEQLLDDAGVVVRARRRGACRARCT